MLRAEYNTPARPEVDGAGGSGNVLANNHQVALSIQRRVYLSVVAVRPTTRTLVIHSAARFYRNCPSDHARNLPQPSESNMTHPTRKLRPETRQFLRYLHAHPSVRTEIQAPEHATVLYAGTLFRKAFEELKALQATPTGRHLVMLEDVLKKVAAPDTDYPTLYAYANAASSNERQDEDTLIIWRALSGIYAAQARGQVSFYVGKGVSRDKNDLQNRKVFALTEVHVLERNGHLDTLTKDIVAYFQRCLRNPKESTAFSFIGAAGRLD